MALPKLERNCSAVRDTDLCSLAGFLNSGRVACNAESGSLSTPLIWAASMPMAAAPLFIPQQLLGDHAPEGMPDENGLGGKGLDDGGIVVGHVVAA
jgi:hypothetical protein